MSGVIKGLAQVAAYVAKEGIAKARKNEQQGYKFRGIDDVYNALSLPLAEAELVCIPTVLSRSVSERVNKSGTVLFYVVVEVKYTIYSGKDGSTVEGIGIGEAMDTGDKATNKAQSAAYKYFWMQTLCIPTEGDNDADSTTHKDIAPQQEVVPEGAASAFDGLALCESYEDFKAVWAAIDQPKRQWIIKAKQKELAELRAKLQPAA